MTERVEDELATVHHELMDPDDFIPFGVVHVGSFASAARVLLLSPLSSLATTNPELEVIAEETKERNALPRLRRSELDLVLMGCGEYMLPATPRGMADIPLPDESWLVTVPAEQVVPPTLADPARTIQIDLTPGAAGAFALGRLERQLRVSLTTWHVVYGYGVMLAIVSQGLGCAPLPRLVVYSGLVSDELSVVRLPRLGAHRLAVHHRSIRTKLGPATRAVLEVLLFRAQGIELGWMTNEGTTVRVTELPSEPSSPRRRSSQVLPQTPFRGH